MNCYDEKTGTGMGIDEINLYRMIGENCKRAREIVNLSRKEAQIKIWGYKNRDMQANRITELEKGSKKIDLKTLYKVAIVYGVSVDYLMGFSNSFERDYEASQTGVVFNSIRETILEGANKLCLQASRVMRYLPPFQGEVLKSSAQKVCDEIYKLQLDLDFRARHGDLIDLAYECRNRIQDFDTVIARQVRIIETEMMDSINSLSDKQSVKRLTTINNGEDTIDESDDYETETFVQ